MHSRILIIFFLLGIHLTSVGQGVEVSPKMKEPVLLLDHLTVLEDESSSWTPQEVLALYQSGDLATKVVRKDTLQSYTSTFWAVFILRNVGEQAFEGMLETGGSDKVSLHQFYDGEFLSVKKGGRLTVASEREFAFGNPKEVRVSVEVPVEGEVIYLLQIHNKTGYPVFFSNTKLQEKEAWKDTYRPKENSLFLTVGLLCGFMGIMAIYNIFIFVFSKDSIFLFYTLYIVLPLMYMLARFGVLNDTILGEILILFFYVRAIIPPIALIVYLQFLRLYLATKEEYPKWDRFFKWLMVVEVVCFILVFFLVPTEKEKIIVTVPSIIHAFVQLSTITLLVTIILRKDRPIKALYLTVGTILFFSGSIFFILVLTFRFVSLEFGMLVQAFGIACELIAYSLGLGYRIKIMDKAKRLVQEENARILANQNRVLEEKVLKRTFDIEQQKEEILTQNEELQQKHEEIVAQRDYIAQQHDELSHKNGEITASIRYAKTIQETLLPYEERIKAAFHSELFVIFRPKDIVSGDFYWFEEVDNKKFLVVADCTGHGVPGAFMGMIGFSILNDEIIKSRNHNPADVLGKMHAHVHRVLKQKEDHGNQDGMDISLCMIEEQGDQVLLTYSGAKRPLYYLRPSDTETQQLKGDRVSIGGHRKVRKAFTNHQLVLPRGSVIYMCSDGWTDQHNLKGKKFGALKLKSMLSKVHKLPMYGQESTLSQVLDMYQENQVQRDDITLLGARL